MQQLRPLHYSPRLLRCTLFESRFEVAQASVAEKQEYASCVETLYPQPVILTGNDTYAIKGVIVILLIALVVGAVHGYRDLGDLGGAILGAICGVCFTALSMLALALIAAGIAYLFS